MTDNLRGDRTVSEYWAGVAGKKGIAQVEERISEYFHELEESGRIDVMRRAVCAWHGQDENGGFKDSSLVKFGGEEGETLEVKVNHFRSLGKHILVMATEDRPAFDARAVNSDAESQAQTTLAEGLLDYYLSEKHIEDKLHRATELGVVVAEGWVSVTWDHAAGADFAVEAMQGEEDPYGGRIVKEGDVSVRWHAPWSIARDLRYDPEDAPWIALLCPANKWDLAARYAGNDEEMRSKILKCTPADEDENATQLFDRPSRKVDADRVVVREFYHQRTDALPNGRHLLYVGDVVLFDGPLPYEDLPGMPMVPALELDEGASIGDAWPLLSLQTLYDAVISVMMTNHDAFGHQNVLIPDNSNVSVDDLGNGLSGIRYNANNANGAKPEALQLLEIPEASFKLEELLRGAMEVISGVNKVARGEPPPQLKSGSALAMVQSMALQYNSAIQRAYVRLLEKVGTAIIRLLQQYAHTPRIAHIVGRDNRPLLQKFTSDSIGAIRRVIVDVSNPILRTTQGKADLAERWLEQGLIKTPEQYFQVLETGRLEPVMQRPTSQMALIKSENERLMDGQPTPVLVTDLHHVHIEEHLCALDSPEVRMDPNKAKTILDHIMEHKVQRMSMDPVIAELTGQMPLQSMAMMAPPGPGGPEGPGGPPPEDEGEETVRADAPEPSGPARLPRLPDNPMTGEQMPA